MMMPPTSEDIVGLAAAWLAKARTPTAQAARRRH
jgi:hypothetical protein